MEEAAIAVLPTELLEQIVNCCTTHSLVALAATNRALRRIVEAHADHVVHRRMGFQRRVGLRCWDNATPLQRLALARRPLDQRTIYLTDAVDEPGLRAQLRLFGGRPERCPPGLADARTPPPEPSLLVHAAHHEAERDKSLSGWRRGEDRFWLLTVADLYLLVFAPCWPIEELPLPHPKSEQDVDQLDYYVACDKAGVPVEPWSADFLLNRYHRPMPLWLYRASAIVSRFDYSCEDFWVRIERSGDSQCVIEDYYSFVQLTTSQVLVCVFHWRGYLIVRYVDRDTVDGRFWDEEQEPTRYSMKPFCCGDRVYEGDAQQELPSIHLERLISQPYSLKRELDPRRTADYVRWRTSSHKLGEVYCLRRDQRETPEWVGSTTELERAVLAGDVAGVAKAVDRGSSVDDAVSSGETLLHLAVAHDRCAIVSQLLALGADVNEEDRAGRTPLHVAAAWACLACLKAIAERPSCNLEARDLIEMTPLLVAAQHGRTDCLLALAEGASHLLTARRRDGWGALELAAFGGHEDTVAALVRLANSAEADVGGTKRRRCLALDDVSVAEADLAARGDHAACVRQLASLATDANWWSVRDHGETALHVAARVGAVECIEALMALPGIDVNACDSERRTPLHIAAIAGETDSVTALLACGARRDLADVKGNYPVDVASDGATRRRLHEWFGTAVRDFDAQEEGELSVAAGDTVQLLGRYNGWWHARYTWSSWTGRVPIDRLVPIGDEPPPPKQLTIHGPNVEVHAVAAAPDACRCLTGSDDGVARIALLATGRCERLLEGHEGAVYAVAFTPCGRRCVTASADATVRVWATHSGACERVLRGHASAVRSLAIAPDGSRCVSGSDDATLRVWSLVSGECERLLAGHTGRVLALAVSADGRRCISGSVDATARIWLLETGECERVLTGHTGEVRRVAFTGDGRRCMTGSGDETARFWQRETGTSECVASKVSDAMMTPDERRCVTLLDRNEKERVSIWSMETLQCEHLLNTDATTIAVTSDYVVCFCWQGVEHWLELWSVTEGVLLRELRVGRTVAGAAAVSPDSRCCIGVYRGPAKVWWLERSVDVSQRLPH